MYKSWKQEAQLVFLYKGCVVLLKLRESFSLWVECSGNFCGGVYYLESLVDAGVSLVLVCEKVKNWVNGNVFVELTF